MSQDAAGQPVAVFLSYRRGDTQWAARGLYEELADKYGRQNVFRDLDGVPPGARFRDYVEKKIAESNVFVLLIGKTWASYTDAAGRRRLELPRDPVRLEVETALRLGIPIIPVRVEGAPMPTEEDLVPSIVDLLEFNAAEVTDSRWEYDVNKLLQAIGATVERGRQPPKPESTGEPDLPRDPSYQQPALRPRDQAAPGARPVGSPGTPTVQDVATPPPADDARDENIDEHSTTPTPDMVPTPTTPGPAVTTRQAVPTGRVTSPPRNHEPPARDRRPARVPVRRRGVVLAAAAILGCVALLVAYLVSTRAMEAQIMGHLPVNLRASCTATNSESATCQLTDGTVVFFRMFDTAAQADADVVGRNEVVTDGSPCPPSAPSAGASVTCRYTVGGQSGVATFGYTAKGSIHSFWCRWIGDAEPSLRGEMSTANVNPQDWATLQANWNQLAGM